MSLVTIHHTLLDASDQPCVHAYVEIRTLSPQISDPFVYSDDGGFEIVGTVRTYSDVNGEWEVDLIPTDELSPAGTVYEVIQVPAGMSQTRTIIAPESAATPFYELINCLADEPGELASGALTAHLQDDHPHQGHIAVLPNDGDDGQVLGWDSGPAWTEPTGGGSGAPTDATYLTTTANGSLSAEVVVGPTPGGELGGTWSAPTVDTTHSGSSHAQVQTAAENTAAAALAAHEGDSTNVHGITNTAALETTTGAAAKITAHVALSDPHTQYLKESDYDALPTGAEPGQVLAWQDGATPGLTWDDALSLTYLSNHLVGKYRGVYNNGRVYAGMDVVQSGSTVYWRVGESAMGDNPATSTTGNWVENDNDLPYVLFSDSGDDGGDGPNDPTPGFGGAPGSLIIRNFGGDGEIWFKVSTDEYSWTNLYIDIHESVGLDDVIVNLAANFVGTYKGTYNNGTSYFPGWVVLDGGNLYRRIGPVDDGDEPGENPRWFVFDDRPFILSSDSREGSNPVDENLPGPAGSLVFRNNDGTPELWYKATASDGAWNNLLTELGGGSGIPDGESDGQVLYWWQSQATPGPVWDDAIVSPGDFGSSYSWSHIGNYLGEWTAGSYPAGSVVHHLSNRSLWFAQLQTSAEPGESDWSQHDFTPDLSGTGDCPIILRMGSEIDFPAEGNPTYPRACPGSLAMRETGDLWRYDADDGWGVLTFGGADIAPWRVNDTGYLVSDGTGEAIVIPDSNGTLSIGMLAEDLGTTGAYVTLYGRNSGGDTGGAFDLNLDARDGNRSFTIYRYDGGYDPMYEFRSDGLIKLSGDTGTEGQVIAADADGIATWTTPTGDLTASDFRTTGDGTLGITQSTPGVGFGVEVGVNDNAHFEVTSPVNGVAYADFTVVDVDAKARIGWWDAANEFRIILNAGHTLTFNAGGELLIDGTPVTGGDGSIDPLRLVANWSGAPWDAEAGYVPGDLVSDGTDTYICILATTGDDPTTDSDVHWTGQNAATLVVRGGSSPNESGLVLGGSSIYLHNSAGEVWISQGGPGSWILLYPQPRPSVFVVEDDDVDDIPNNYWDGSSEDVTIIVTGLTNNRGVLLFEPNTTNFPDGTKITFKADASCNETNYFQITPDAATTLDGITSPFLLASPNSAVTVVCDQASNAWWVVGAYVD